MRIHTITGKLKYHDTKSDRQKFKKQPFETDFGSLTISSQSMQFSNLHLLILRSRPVTNAYTKQNKRTPRSGHLSEACQEFMKVYAITALAQLIGIN